jgi:sugar lactone lactonase YvrE
VVGSHAQFRLLAEGLQVPESPRWHDGRWWFSDIMGQAVGTVTLEGSAQVVHSLADRPSGLGWDIEGHLLVVSQLDCKLLRESNGLLVEFCDLSPFFRPNGESSLWRPNDMVVDDQGRAYIGSLTMTGSGRTPLVLVAPDGSAEVLVEDLQSPNGLAISPDGSMLVTAEGPAQRLTAFSVDKRGHLGHRRVFADLDAHPDGICFDEEGYVWAACPTGGSLARVDERGVVAEVINMDGRFPLACMLGGNDGHSMFVAAVTGHWSPELDTFVDSSGSIHTGQVGCVEVGVGRGGLP